MSKFQTGDLVELKHEAKPELSIYIEEVVIAKNHPWPPIHSVSKIFEINQGRYREVYTEYLRKIDE
jgi:hypothetical protein